MAYTALGQPLGVSTATGATLLLDAAIKGAIVLLAVGMVILAMRRASAAMRHLVWTAGLWSLLVMPLISLVVPRWEVLPEWLRAESIVNLIRAPSSDKATPLLTGQPASTMRQVSSDPVDGSNVPESAVVVPDHGSPTTSPGVVSGELPGADDVRDAATATWLAAAAWVWGLGAAVLILRIGLSRINLWRVVKAASCIQDGPVHRQIRKAQQRYGINHIIRAYLSNKRDLPMTWGILSTHILLPSDAAQWPSGRLEAVLLHELAHVKRRDTITHVVGQLACAVYWINPLVWLAAWRIHVERERACDDLVVCTGIKSSDYAEHLLNVVGNCGNRRVVPCSAVAMAKASRLEGRLLAILSDRLNRKSASRGFFGAVLVAGCTTVIAVAMLHAQDPHADANRVLSGESIGLVSDDMGEAIISRLNAFFTAVSLGRIDKALKLVGPDVPRGQLNDLARLGKDRLTVETLFYADPAHALAVTSPVSVDDAGGDRVGHLVLTLVKKEGSWRVRDIDFETDKSLKVEIERFRADFSDAEQIAAGSTSTRRFVRLVIGPDRKMTFQGRATTWRKLPTLLAEVPHRPETVLEYAISTEQLTVAQLNKIQFRAAILAEQHGFEHASYVGVHPLGSKGSKETTRRDDSATTNPPSKSGDPIGDTHGGRSLTWPLDEADGRIILAEPAKDHFDSIAQLAGLRATEASALDSMLRGQSFDGFDALREYDPDDFAGDAAALRRALEKLFELEERQANVLKRIEGMLAANELSDAELDSLRKLQTRIRRQYAARVLSVREVFRPFPSSGKRASWTALAKRRFEDDEHYMAMARSPVGGEFPVRFEGEDAERFRVRLVTGDDDRITVKVVFQIDEIPSEQVEKEFRLVRDKPVEIEINGARFSLLYPSMYLARSGPATTDLAHVIVSYRSVDRDEKESAERDVGPR